MRARALLTASLPHHASVMGHQCVTDKRPKCAALNWTSLHFVPFRNDIGMRFHTHFNPIPLPLIALFMTSVRSVFLLELSSANTIPSRSQCQLQCCLDAWASGRFDKEHKMSKTYATKYELHLKDANDWKGEKPVLVDKLRQKMFDRTLYVP